jgi:hypothetical protein
MPRHRVQYDERPRPTNPPRDAEGVGYTALAAAPGLKMFSCEPLRASLSQKGCGIRWFEAQTATGHGGERLEICRSCPIGAAHAGETAVYYSSRYGSMICPACRKGTTRMIKNRVCVSCYNRRREISTGKNGRGNVPVELLRKPPHTVEFIACIDGKPKRVQAPECMDMLEAMLRTLRTTKGNISFGFAGQPVSRIAKDAHD